MSDLQNAICTSDVIRLAIGGITVHLGPPAPDSTRRLGGAISSDLHHPDDPAELKAALDAIESLILAHAVAGADITSSAYFEALQVTLDAAFTRYSG